MTAKNTLVGIVKNIQTLYRSSLSLSITITLLIALTIGLAVFLFFYTAAPNTITITTGPEGSIFKKNAERYKAILAKEGITLKIVYSEGSEDNLHKLLDKKTKVDVGFVQGGETNGLNIDNLISLGSVSYQPLMIFYNGKPKSLLSEFKGQRLDIGQIGSGTHDIALSLLKLNGIEEKGDTVFVDNPPSESINALLNKRIDALFVMGDSASPELIHKLLHTTNINLFNFSQADAYTRKVNYLHKMDLPAGAIDFGKNIPSEDLLLIGPTVELVARKDFHPALSDALLEAAREVHGSPGLMKKRGEFPAPMEHEFQISQDAIRFYSTGKSFLYRTFPFWFASLINRTIAFIVPIGLLLIPGIKIAPAIYRWRIQSRIYPWYKNLFEVEREAFKDNIQQNKLDELIAKLDDIENAVNKIKIPANYGDLFYGLKGHISYVRERLLSLKLKS